jgi:hypothetical protein
MLARWTEVTRPVKSEASKFRVLSVSLVVLDGPSRWQARRARGNEVMLTDPTVSRVHCNRAADGAG